LAGFFCGEEAFEDAEVYVNGEVVVGDQHGTGDGRADHIQRAHSGDQRKGEGVGVPAAVLLNEFDGQTDRAGEDVVKRAVESPLDVVLVAVVGDGDLHEEPNLSGSGDGRNTGCAVFAGVVALGKIFLNWRPCLPAGSLFRQEDYA
jgi:hypothetical protein